MIWWANMERWTFSQSETFFSGLEIHRNMLTLENRCFHHTPVVFFINTCTIETLIIFMWDSNYRLHFCRDFNDTNKEWIACCAKQAFSRLSKCDINVSLVQPSSLYSQTIYNCPIVPFIEHTLILNKTRNEYPGKPETIITADYAPIYGVACLSLTLTLSGSVLRSLARNICKKIADSLMQLWLWQI